MALGWRRQVWLTTLLLTAVAMPMHAHDTTGKVAGVVTSQDGKPLSGAVLEIADDDRGLHFTVVSRSDGRYIFTALPVGEYRLTAKSTGFAAVTRGVRVELGRTTTADIELPLGVVSHTIEVSGDTPLVDTSTTVAGFTADLGRLSSRLPLTRDVTQIALLAPATAPADARFDNGTVWSGVSGGATRLYTPGQSVTAMVGSSSAENLYLVNGLNTTNVYQGLGSTFVPMEFVEEVQIKTGGYEAEYGRSTGGVINLVTKSGSNTLHGAASVNWEPERLQSVQPDTYATDDDGNRRIDEHNQDEERSFAEANFSLGGPIVRDHLFALAFVRFVDSDQLEIFSNLAQRSAYQTPHWGAKLDWNITSRHRLEGTYLSDSTNVDTTNSTFDATTRSVGDVIDTGTRSRGGHNAIIRYTGVISDGFLLSAQVGQNQFDHTDQSTREDECPYARDVRTGVPQYVGCWIFVWRATLKDSRQAARIDGDLFVGRHSLRAGVDAEATESPVYAEHSGGRYYRYLRNGSEGQDPSDYYFPDLPWGQELVRDRYFEVKGTYSVDSESAYAQDSWSATPNLTLNLGLRWEQYRVTNAADATFLDISNQIAPRAGVVWDPGGEGRSKLYGSVGTYHLPVGTDIMVNNMAGEWTWTRSWFPLEGGILPDGTPEALGPQIGETQVLANGVVPDPGLYVDTEVEPMSQDELIIGFEHAVGDNWTLGVRGVARRFNQVIEDIDISRAMWEVYGFEPCSPDNFPSPLCDFFQTLRVTNPGTDFHGYYDFNGDLVPDDEIVLTADQLGIPEPVRNYRAVELTVQRRFADGWMLQGSYTWSHLEGNYGGMVNSDLGQDLPNLNIDFDLAAQMEHSRGDLPNDRRHNLKLFGSYLWHLGLQVGGSFWYRSGRPVNGFGMHPTDPWTQAWATGPMNGPFSFYNDGEPCPRGCGGTIPDTWALDMSARYELRAAGGDWYARLDVFNLFDNQGVVQVEDVAEDEHFLANPNYLEVRYYQPPRTIRFGVGVSF